MKRTSLVLLMIAFCISVYAQKDTKAKKILDELSAKTKAYTSIMAVFNYSLDSRQNNVSDTFKGRIFLKGDKYKLFLMGSEIYFDGKTMTTHMVDDEEATVSEPDLNAKETLNPADIFTIYEKGFKYSLMGEEKIDNRNLYLIELVPENRKDKKYVKIKLFIDKDKMEIYKIKQIGKDGNDFSIELTELKSDLKIVDKLFTFDHKAHPDVEIIDMR